MNYKKLGNTGLSVSEISLGSWLNYGHSIEKEASQAIIEHAYEMGINFFDCSSTDRLNDSERIIGETLRQYNRYSYILCTGSSFNSHLPCCLSQGSKKFLYDQVHESLKKLNSDYIDIFILDFFDSETNLYETLRTMDDFIRQGKILYFGVNGWNALQLLESLKIQDTFLLDRLVLNHIKYNLFEPFLDQDLLQIMKKNEIGIIGYSCLAEGFLSAKYRKGKELPKESRAANEEINKSIQQYLIPENFSAIEKFLQFAIKKGYTTSQLAIKWCLSQNILSSVLVGISKISQIEENINALDIELSTDEIVEIENFFRKNVDSEGKMV